jgi:hypothetical protein
MSMERWCGVVTLVALGLVGLGAPGAARAQAAESVGMVTELKMGRGRVEVQAAGKADWRVAGPFLALRAGDTVRASGDASAVILLAGGRGTVRVDASRSPLVMAAAAPDDGKLQKARSLVEGSVKFLAAGPKEPPKAVLSVRAGAAAPVVLAPRNSAVLPGPLTVEWLGSPSARYAVRLTGPSGVVVEQTGIPGARWGYPAEAPPLAPGVRYTVQVRPAVGRAQEASFEVLDAARAATVREHLREVEEALGPGVPASTLAVVRSGLLAEQGLLHDARLALLAALGQDPEEPALHTLLAQLYRTVGLPQQAAEAHAEAEFLLTRGGR